MTATEALAHSWFSEDLMAGGSTVLGVHGILYEEARMSVAQYSRIVTGVMASSQLVPSTEALREDYFAFQRIGSKRMGSKGVVGFGTAELRDSLLGAEAIFEARFSTEDL